MKLFLNSFVFFCFVCCPLFGEQIEKNYLVKVGGIKIGELSWQFKLTDNNYSTKIDLRSKGLLSAIYSFRGEYFSEGINFENQLIPKKYTHFWQTKKTIKNMELDFIDRKLQKIKQSPAEKEKIRLNVFEIHHTNDPLTSFVKIMMGKKNSLVVDGRRHYTMKALSNDNKNQIVVEISNYFNLWADHKRNKFEKIIFEKKNKDFLLSKMFIHFDGRVFRLDEY